MTVRRTTETSSETMAGIQAKPGSWLRDKMLLIVVSLAVCLIGVGAAILCEILHINLGWFIFAWGAVFLFPLVGKEFRGYFRRPAFVLFFAVWMCVHGATVAAMIAWLSALLWPVVLVLELGLGFTFAHWLFHFPLKKTTQRPNALDEPTGKADTT